ncbi:hypothetical protein [Bifidobacterium bifidum]|uniref:hypothetical protein n=1 Tax=Bifidobacterium bifidum TaxID=1681 RepID=UPI001EE553F6|nr:hypothetical protein [Bifidobacterium bifidum]
MSEIQVHNGSGSASSHKPAVAVVNSNFNKQAPETLPEYTCARWTVTSCSPSAGSAPKATC